MSRAREPLGDDLRRRRGLTRVNKEHQPRESPFDMHAALLDDVVRTPSVRFRTGIHWEFRGVDDLQQVSPWRLLVGILVLAAVADVINDQDRTIGGSFA